MNIQKINTQYNFLFKIPEGYIPNRLELGKMSCTLIPKEADAYSLDGFIAGAYKSPKMGELESIKIKNKGLLLRTIIGYSKMLKVESDLTYGCLVISDVINTMLFEAYKYKTDLNTPFKKETFNRPGEYNTFFRELENNAGFELRLYIEF